MEHPRLRKRAIRGAAVAGPAVARASVAKRRCSGLRRGVLAAVVAALLVAGCSGDGDDSAADDAASADDASPVQGPADDGVGSELLLATRGALYTAIAQDMIRPPEYYQAVKECMKAQGFEYHEPPPPEFLIPLSEMTSLLQEVAALDPTSSLYRNRYGYGVSTVDAYLWTVGYADEDPNWEMLQTMSAAEQQAWATALYGPAEGKTFAPDWQPTEENLSEDQPFKSDGCHKEAEDAAGVSRDPQDEAYASRQETWLRIEASEGYVELEQDWARCAAEQGFEDLASFDDLYRLLYEKLSEIQVPSRWNNLAEEGFANLSEDEIDEVAEWQGPEYSLDHLAVVQQEELEIAARLADCDRAYWTGFAELEDRLRPATTEG